LRQALTVRYMAGRRGLGCQICFGMRHLANGQPEAHAWITYEGQLVGETEQSLADVSRFNTVP
jgi:hypothetical protein